MLAFVMVTDRRFCNAYFNTTPLLTCLQLLWSHPLLWGSEAIPLDSDGPSALRKVALKMIQHHLKIQHTVLGFFFAVVELMYLFLGPTLKKKKKNQEYAYIYMHHMYNILWLSKDFWIFPSFKASMKSGGKHTLNCYSWFPEHVWVF